MKLTKLFFGLMILSFLGCDQLSTQSVSNTKFKLINSQATYQIAVPDYMEPGTELSDDASLQYQNLYKELYVVVLDESWREFKESYQNARIYNDSLSVLDNYVDVQYDAISLDIEITSDVIRKSVKINGLPARIIQFDGMVDVIDVPVTYYYTFYQGPDNIYMMLSWTAKSKKSKHLPIQEKIAKSFVIKENI